MAVTASPVRLTLAVAVFTAIVATIVSMLPAAAYADPDDEGGSASLSEKLEDAARGYYDIQAKLLASQKRQKELKKNLQIAELALVRLNVEVGNIAAARYKSGQLGVINGFLLGRGQTNELLQGAAVAEYLAWRDDDELRRYRETRDTAARQRELLDAEVANEKNQLKELDKQKRKAEKALASVGGMVSAGYSGPKPKEAQPAPRNADGSFPGESCSVPDPTSAGCLTPRMYHALNEARLAGFNHYVHCWRTQSWGEHPKGRACDFAADKNSFGGRATGASKTYGNQLASWCIKNANALGVLYVIWYRQIWMPGIGWRTYFGTGDASSEHTNHVHLSML